MIPDLQRLFCLQLSAKAFYHHASCSSACHTEKYQAISRQLQRTFVVELEGGPPLNHYIVHYQVPSEFYDGYYDRVSYTADINDQVAIRIRKERECLYYDNGTVTSALYYVDEMLTQMELSRKTLLGRLVSEYYYNTQGAIMKRDHGHKGMPLVTLNYDKGKLTWIQLHNPYAIFTWEDIGQFAAANVIVQGLVVRPTNKRALLVWMAASFLPLLIFPRMWSLLNKGMRSIWARLRV